jgi:hypothetical protein
MCLGLILKNLSICEYLLGPVIFAEIVVLLLQFFLVSIKSFILSGLLKNKYIYLSNKFVDIENIYIFVEDN